jgi:hypothetical protein|tara:strand:+ start:8642 stop:8830 length:189 start_codon:yes stop_codon:yes gene_type:complete
MDEWITIPTSSGETMINYNSISAITIAGNSCDIHLVSGTIFTTPMKNMESILSNMSQIIITQ